jgi:c-di-GMP-binding flagellar brake protein YcgR
MIYSFESSLLQQAMNPLPVWTIGKPENVQKLQQRSFFRCPARLPVRYFRLNEAGQPVYESEVNAFSRNLSGGGILLSSERSPQLPVGEKLWLEIGLSRHEVIKTLAVMVRMDIHKTKNGKMSFLAALQFLEMDEFLRKKIIQLLNRKILEERGGGFIT